MIKKMIGHILHGAHSIIKPHIILTPCNNVIYSTNYPGFNRRIFYTRNCDHLLCRYFDPNNPEAYQYPSRSAFYKKVVKGKGGPIAYWPLGRRTVRGSPCLGHSIWKAEPIPLLPLPFLPCIKSGTHLTAG